MACITLTPFFEFFFSKGENFLNTIYVVNFRSRAGLKDFLGFGIGKKGRDPGIPGAGNPA